MAGTYDSCAACGIAMQHPDGRGKARKYCSSDCRKRASAERGAARGYEVCCIQGCEADATRQGAKMCEKHYTRVRRNGTSDYVGAAVHGKLVHSNGYLRVAAQGHPLARGQYRAYEHRVVYHALHGDGPFCCHWCAKAVTWNDMHVDHLDDDRTNNSETNLVASCAKCNQKRGVAKMKATARTKYGITFNGVNRTVMGRARELGICRSALLHRLDAGWPLERALTEPRGRFGPRQSTQTHRPKNEAPRPA